VEGLEVDDLLCSRNAPGSSVWLAGLSGLSGSPK